MKKFQKGMYILGIAGALTVGALLGGNTGLVGSANPGSADDPLVTRSYVHQAVQRALQDLPAGVGGSSSVAFAPVQVSAGNVILGGEGSVVILRSGIATAHVPGPDGIVNTSLGVDMFQGDHIITNHYLIIPRNDGR
ncbi:MAG: hypothetical protein FWB98_07165, partial [Defluviitaleaceae bacterium]|nr:hypothetical protein [Defluviitaleaceae bacterium]